VMSLLASHRHSPHIHAAASPQPTSLSYHSCGSQQDDSYPAVLLTAARTPTQDMLALPAEEVGAVLQRFLRNERTLKVGSSRVLAYNHGAVQAGI